MKDEKYYGEAIRNVILLSIPLIMLISFSLIALLIYQNKFTLFVTCCLIVVQLFLSLTIKAIKYDKKLNDKKIKEQVE